MTNDFIRLSIEASRVFTPGAPVSEKSLFSGRLPQISLLIDTTYSVGMHAVLYGERGVGKTSLVNVFAAFLRDTGADVLAPRVNCVTTDTFNSIWKKLFARIKIKQTTERIGFLSTTIEDSISLGDRIGGEMTPDRVVNTLEALSGGPKIVLVIDEFDRIEDPTVKSEMADTIKMMSDQQTDATIIIVGVADSVDTLIAEHQSIERAVKQIHMPRMMADELRQIITHGLSEISMKIDQSALAELVSLSKGLPYFAHLLGLHASKAACDAHCMEISQLHLEAAIKTAIQNAQQSMKTSYHRATKSVRTEAIFRYVLLAAALAATDEFGYFTAASVVEPLSAIRGKRYDIPNFAGHLKRFTEPERGEVLEMIGGPHSRMYRFANPMMQPFVIMRGLSDSIVDAATLEKFNQISFEAAPEVT